MWKIGCGPGFLAGRNFGAWMSELNYETPEIPQYGGILNRQRP